MINFGKQAGVCLGILGMIALSLGGCTVTAPRLTPDVAVMNQEVHTDQLDHQFKVSVRPLVTTGVRSEDRQQFGVDLSAYFTAFYIEIENGLSHPVWVDATQIFLQYNDQQPVQTLSESEGVEYYRHGDGLRPVLTLIPKSRKLEKEELSKIRDLRLRSATLPPTSRHAGVVYFRKIQDRDCDGVILRMREIQIEEAGSSQEVHFSFRCGD
jgi:hypothetical protein